MADEVRADLSGADLVSVKVDAVDEGMWRRVNRPNPSLTLGRVLEGLLEFSESYRGTLISETMLVHSLNTDPESYRGIASYLSKLSPRRAYLAVPVRPPAENYAKPPFEEELLKAYSELSKMLTPGRVELLNMPEPPPSTVYGDPATWLLNTVSVHPLRYDYAVRVLRRTVPDPEEVVEELVKKGLVLKVQYAGATYLVRNFG